MGVLIVFNIQRSAHLIDGVVGPRVQHLRRPVHGGAVLGQLVLQERPLVHAPVLVRVVLLGRGRAKVTQLYTKVFRQ